MDQVVENTAAVLGGFDPQYTTIRDPKTKAIIKENPYKLIVAKGKSFYEWPVGSGNLWFRNRTAAGRLEAGEIIEGKKHEVYIEPKPESHDISVKLAQKEQENARLIKELEEIKREQKYSDKPKEKMPSQKLSEAMTKGK